MILCVITDPDHIRVGTQSSSRAEEYADSCTDLVSSDVNIEVFLNMDIIFENQATNVDF